MYLGPPKMGKVTLLHGPLRILLSTYILFVCDTLTHLPSDMKKLLDLTRGSEQEKDRQQIQTMLQDALPLALHGPVDPEVLSASLTDRDAVWFFWEDLRVKQYGP